MRAQAVCKILQIISSHAIHFGAATKDVRLLRAVLLACGSGSELCSDESLIQEAAVLLIKGPSRLLSHCLEFCSTQSAGAILFVFPHHLLPAAMQPCMTIGS